MAINLAELYREGINDDYNSINEPKRIRSLIP